MLATFVRVFGNPRKELGIMVVNGLTQASCTTLWLKKVSWTFSLASVIKEILCSVRTFSCLYLAQCCANSIFFWHSLFNNMLNISQVKRWAMRVITALLSASHFSLLKLYCWAPKKSRFGYMRKSLWEWAWPSKLLTRAFTSKVTADFKHQRSRRRQKHDLISQDRGCLFWHEK